MSQDSVMYELGDIHNAYSSEKYCNFSSCNNKNMTLNSVHVFIIEIH